MLLRSRDGGIVAVVLVWITFGLLADVSVTPAGQRWLGVMSWALLLVLLRGERPAVRLQVLIAVAFATLAEVAGSGLLKAYTYRLGNIPIFVPPGHGMVYLAAIAGARTACVRQRITGIRWTVVALCGAWTAWGVLVSPRVDVLGAALFVVFAGCLFAWQSPSVYALAFLVTTWLELLGTSLGNWTWAVQSGWLSAGNPPSAVVAGYCVIDAVALALGAAVFAWQPAFRLPETRPARPAEYEAALGGYGG